MDFITIILTHASKLFVESFSINLGKCNCAAQGLALAKLDLVLVQEPPHSLPPVAGFVWNCSGRAAILVSNRLRRMSIKVPSTSDICIVRVNKCTFISYYHDQQLLSYSKIEDATSNISGPTIIGGDFNATHPVWSQRNCTAAARWQLRRLRTQLRTRSHASRVRF